MFGFGQKKTQAEIDREAVIERAKMAVRQLVHSMEGASPSDAERTGKQIKDRCNNEKTLPLEFKQKALIRAKELECIANMRKCDAVLHEASFLATAEKLTEKKRQAGDGTGTLQQGLFLGGPTRNGVKHSSGRPIPSC